MLYSLIFLLRLTPEETSFFFKKDVFLPGRWNPEVSVGVGSSETLLGLGQSPRTGQTPRPLPLPGSDLTSVLQELGRCVLVRDTSFSPSGLAHSGQRRRKRKTDFRQRRCVCVCFPWVASAGELAPRSWLGLETVPSTSHKGSPIHKHPE